MERTMSKETGWSIPGPGAVLGVARAGLHLGLGLAAMAIDMAQGIAEEAIRRGAEVEKDGLERATRLEREATEHMKEYLHARKREQERSNVSIEARVEQALATFDVPTRDDIRELHQHLAAVGEKINELQRG